MTGGSHIDVGSRGTKLTIEAEQVEKEVAAESRGVYTSKMKERRRAKGKKRTGQEETRGSSITELTDEDRAQKREITSAGTTGRFARRRTI